MAKEKDNMTDAYRAERKERLAKQAKKNGKKNPTHESGKRLIGKIIGIVLCAGIVCLALWGILSFFGVPQRVAKAVYVDGKGYSESELNFYYFTAWNSQVSTANYYDQNFGEGTGSSLTGFNANVSPADQTTKDDDGNEITWAEKLMDIAVEQLASVKRHCAEAEKAGITLSEDDEAEVKSSIDSYKSQLSGSNYSLSRYLQLVFGKGITAGKFESILREQKLAEVFDEVKKDGFAENVAEEEIVSIYEESVSDYDVVDMKLWQVKVVETEAADEAEAEPVSGETLAEEVTGAAAASETAEPVSEPAGPVIDTLEKAHAEADAIVSEIRANGGNADAFVKTINDGHVPADDAADYSDPARTTVEKVALSTLKSNVSADAANWVFERANGKYARQDGEMSTFETSDGKSVYVVFVLKAPYRDDGLAASARHILIKFDPDAAEPVSGEETTDQSGEAVKTRAQAQAEAESILADYNSYVKDQNDGKPDEDYFGQLADKYSEDPGSVAGSDTSSGGTTGGLIEDMVNNGSYVKNFEDWVFGEGDFAGETRAEGDTAIIETEFGLHIMYFVGGHDEPTWKETIRDKVASDAFEAWEKEFEAAHPAEDIVRKDRVVNRVMNDQLDAIESRLTQA